MIPTFNTPQSGSKNGVANLLEETVDLPNRWLRARSIEVSYIWIYL
jgi:hypothetical protein